MVCIIVHVGLKFVLIFEDGHTCTFLVHVFIRLTLNFNRKSNVLVLDSMNMLENK